MSTANVPRRERFVRRFLRAFFGAQWCGISRHWVYPSWTIGHDCPLRPDPRRPE